MSPLTDWLLRRRLLFWVVHNARLALNIRVCKRSWPGESVLHIWGCTPLSV